MEECPLISVVSIVNNILYTVGLDGGLVPGDFNGNSQSPSRLDAGIRMLIWFR